MLSFSLGIKILMCLELWGLDVEHSLFDLHVSVLAEKLDKSLRFSVRDLFWIYIEELYKDRVKSVLEHIEITVLLKHLRNFTCFKFLNEAFLELDVNTGGEFLSL